MKTNVLSLGNLYISDFLTDDQQSLEKSELNLILEDTGLVRLDKTVNRDAMYGRYWYRSGTNISMRNDLLDIVTCIDKVKKLSPGDVWLDIACNDGTMLGHVGRLNKEIVRVGIDPCNDSYAIESRQNAEEIVQDYFTAEVYRGTRYGKMQPKIITTIAMFYDLADPASFIRDVRSVIDSNGLWVVQMSYTPLMLKQLAFDNICHEHVYYYSLFNIKKLFEDNGFQIVDCQINSVNGGSFRIYAMPHDADMCSFADQPTRDVAKFRIESTLLMENDMKVDYKETWEKFFDDIERLKETTVSFIKKVKSDGKSVWAYGASTKGNTLLQYFGLDNSMIDGIAERSVYKFGLRTVGTNIPIYSEDHMRNEKPDYLLILPWHFISEFIERESDYLNNGGKFIVPCPKFEIIGK